ncbi:hypothetical protein HNY73_010227 [Argiope bruennichi]|uniref:Uncharacterized protein n=1 Tax=Argiope bruennichi TaxID=94029 RepID=A0A8T0F2L1_ARGBR|nr:hypothetical protein HNY73_010227 [Argiope bruennichi]
MFLKNCVPQSPYLLNLCGLASLFYKKRYARHSHLHIFQRHCKPDPSNHELQLILGSSKDILSDWLWIP